MSTEAAPPPRVHIREFLPEDMSSILEIERSSFSVPWSEGAFRSLLRRRDSLLIVAAEGGRVVGYAAAWFAAGEGELGDLAVDPDHRRRGIGQALVERVRSEARQRGVDRLFLQVRQSNESALALYESIGFRQVGRRQRYYRSPQEDALVLAWVPGDENR